VWNKGKKMPHTPEWEEKRLAAAREARKNIVWRHGYTRPKEHTQPMRDALAKDRKANPEKYKKLSIANLPKNSKGDKNGNWKGGKTPSIRAFRTAKKYQKWRKSVLERDGNKCRMCGTSEHLQVHHLIPISDCRDLSLLRMNGVTLCFDCHKAVDERWGHSEISGETRIGESIAILKTRPHAFRDYDTVGDWAFGSKTLLVLASELGDPKMEACLLIHELIEALLCKFSGVTQKEVVEFDIKFEGDGEPGANPKAPYHAQHMAAEAIEKYVADILKVDWESYGKKIESL
jgi:hypothetical protein